MSRLVWSIGVFMVVAAAHLSGALRPLEFALMDLRFELAKRDPSGHLVIVEIDSRSLQALDSWPWPRGYHATVIDRLREARAKSVALDIDFSSTSTPGEDSKLLQSLRRMDGRVILPGFKQVGTDRAGRRSIVYTEPLDVFARHSRLGLVNVRVESDGRVRRYQAQGTWKKKPVPTLGAILADRKIAGTGAGGFDIDYSIRLKAIPRLSYVDVLRGEFDPEAVAGKVVIVGATAVELGDMLPVPVYSVVPGVMLQALAYESLVLDRGLRQTPPAVPLFIALVLALGLHPLFVKWSWRMGLGVAVGGSSAAFAATAIIQNHYGLIVHTSPLVLAQICAYAVALWRVIDMQALAIVRHWLDAEHRRAMMRSVVDDSFDGIAITDQRGMIEVFNPAAEKILGLHPKVVIGTAIHAYIPLNEEIEDFYTRSSGSDDVAGTAAIGPCEIDVKREGAEDLVIELMVSASRLSAPGKMGKRRLLNKTVHIYTFRDVTERKRTEDAQRKAVEEYAAANRAKTEFVANMSHELRTPLNAIIGFSEIIKGEVLGPVGTSRYINYAGDIYDSGTHLLEIINDILDMAKIESGKMQLNESFVDVERVARTCVRLVEQRARERKIRISVVAPRGLPLIRADERKIKQILSNLLSNAVKFTPEGGSVSVRPYSIGAALALSVVDNGIGIAPENIEKALQSFGQVDSSLQREYEGTGLGLPLVKALVELHDGKFSLASEPNEGTVATAFFPAERTVPREGAESDEGSEQSPHGIGDACNACEQPAGAEVAESRVTLSANTGPDRDVKTGRSPQPLKRISGAVG